MRFKNLAKFIVFPFLISLYLATHASENKEEFSAGEKKIRICTLIDC